jgi:hypothetical protein
MSLPFEDCARSRALRNASASTAAKHILIATRNYRWTAAEIVQVCLKHARDFN